MILKQLPNTPLCNINDTLQTMPPDLPGLYIHLLKRLDENQAKIARSILKWVLYAPRPMELEELAIACSIPSDHDIRAIDKTLTQGLRHHVRLCGPILKIQGDIPVVSLVHQSAKEFLMSSDWILSQSLPTFCITPRDAYRELAIICLQYLSFDEFERGPVDLELHLGPRGWSGQRAVDCTQGTRVNHRQISDVLCDLDKTFRHHPFLKFAATYWPCFVRQIDDSDPGILKAFCRLASATRRLHLAFQIHELTDPDVLAHNTFVNPSALYVSAYMGFVGFINHLLKQQRNTQEPPLGIDGFIRRMKKKGQGIHDTAGGNPLYAAAMNGKSAAVQLLLKCGSRVNMEGGYYGTALGVAAAYGHRDVIEILLKKKLKYTDGLHAAIHSNRPSLLRLLLEHGADANAVDPRGRPALHAAAFNGFDGIARILLEHNANVCAATQDEGTALHISANLGHDAIALRLLGRNANVHVHGGEYGSPLDAAVFGGRASTARILLAHGAIPNGTYTFFEDVRRRHLLHRRKFGEDVSTVEIRVVETPIVREDGKYESKFTYQVLDTSFRGSDGANCMPHSLEVEVPYRTVLRNFVSPNRLVSNRYVRNK